MSLPPGVRIGQVWQAKTPQQRLPWLRITDFDYPVVVGLLTGKRGSCGGREVRIPREQVDVNYRLVSEPDTTPQPVPQREGGNCDVHAGQHDEQPGRGDLHQGAQHDPA